MAVRTEAWRAINLADHFSSNSAPSMWLIPAEPAHLPQYVSLFVVGIIAGRGGWFTDVAPGVAKRWFGIGVTAFIAAMTPFAFRERLPAVLDLQITWGFVEAFVCVGMILGLTVFFRRYCAEPDRWLNRLDRNVYGVYLIHWFVVIALQMAILAIPLPARAKFALVTAPGLAISFSVVAAVRQIPLVRRVV